MMLAGITPMPSTMYVYIQQYIITTIYTFKVSHNEDINPCIVCRIMTPALFDTLAFSILRTYTS